VRGGCCTGPWRRTSRFVGTVVGRSVASSIGFGSQAGSLRHGRGPCSPSPRPSPAAARVLFTGRRFAGEGVTRRGIGFQPVLELILRQWLAVSVGRWLTGCGACWCAGISKDGPSARRLEAYATDGGPCSPSPRPSPAVTWVLLLGSRLVGEGARAAFAAGVGNGSPAVARLVNAGSPRCPAQRAIHSPSQGHRPW
jgi:hypothetical protein